METIRYSQIGKEDISFGTGTFEVTLADGRVVTLTQVDVGSLLNLGLATTTLTGLTLQTATLTGTTTITPPLTLTAALSPTFALNTTSGSDKNTVIDLQSNGTTQFEMGTDSAVNNTQDWYLKDSVAAALRLVMTSAGVLQLTNGQLKFPATQVPSSDVNTLDDYEEGTWTPSLGGTTTYTTQTGAYTKIGNTVTVWVTLVINAIGTGSPTTISGLPFTVAANQYATAGCYFGTSASSITTLTALANANATTITLYSATAAAASLSANNIFQNATTVQFSLTYRV